MSHDPAELETSTIMQLAQIHPMDIRGLTAQSIGVLACAGGLGEDHPFFIPLRAVRTAKELAKIDWDEVTWWFRLLVWFHAKVCQDAVLPIRLFADRALLHQKLFLSKSASTLKLLGLCALPLRVKPLELLGACEDFERAMVQADRALHLGHALLDRFGCQASHGGSCQDLRSLLVRAQTCYEGYQQALQRAYELAGCICWYLATSEQSVRHRLLQVMTHITNTYCDKIEHFWVLLWLQEKNLGMRSANFIAMKTINMSTLSYEQMSAVTPKATVQPSPPAA